ncbi:HepT-like ribonuclease domain-containing protein [Amycolatopsis palatopharyngis]|uniref:HepT-like ribonuclease domain-containing protein n=1 Tax=Amycolatopsis palatopharyngis TaxID=187982 RepID=UPI000E23EBBF|nr:DUF86 domain-containing protein [Amycolatopsis palatopharyngis]
MKRATPERLRDIIETAEIAEQLKPATREEFDADLKGQLALTRLAEIVGEASNHVSKAVQNAHPEVPWSAIIGMRHRIIHGYFEVDLEVLWSVVTVELPALLPQIRAILDSLSADNP